MAKEPKGTPEPWYRRGKHMPADPAADKVGRKWAKDRGEEQPPKSDRPAQHKRSGWR